MFSSSACCTSRSNGKASSKVCSNRVIHREKNSARKIRLSASPSSGPDRPYCWLGRTPKALATTVWHPRFRLGADEDAHADNVFPDDPTFLDLPPIMFSSQSHMRQHMPTGSRRSAADFRNGTHKLNVRVGGQVILTGFLQVMQAALARIGLAFTLEDLVHSYLPDGRPLRVRNECAASALATTCIIRTDLSLRLRSLAVDPSQYKGHGNAAEYTAW
jgi:hypothetical protein